MHARIDRAALAIFIEEQVNLIEATPLPKELAETVKDPAVTGKSLDAVWLCAGIATQIGLLLMGDPERFVYTDNP